MKTDYQKEEFYPSQWDDMERIDADYEKASKLADKICSGVNSEQKEALAKQFIRVTIMYELLAKWKPEAHYGSASGDLLAAIKDVAPSIKIKTDGGES